MGYSWQKANVRPPRSLNEELGTKQIIFKELIDKLNKACFTIVYIDESSFDAKALPLYTWHLRGSEPCKVIREYNQNYNVIAAQWHDQVYFWIKKDSTDSATFLKFMESMVTELRKRIKKHQLERRTVFIMDNAKIHKTEAIQRFIEENELVVFT